MGKVICFHGADHKCGTSMIALCVAEYLSKKYSDLSVLLINAVGTVGSVYSPHVGESMDRIRPYLEEKLIDAESVISNARYSENLYIIDGSTSHYVLESFTPDMSQYFISAIKDKLDIIIVDSGADYNFGLSLGALFAADETYIVIRQKEYSIRRYEWVRALYKKLGIDLDGYVLNMYTRSSPYTKAYLSERLNEDINMFMTVKMSSYGNEAEVDEKSLMNYKDYSFRRQIKRIADYLISTEGQPV